MAKEIEVFEGDEDGYGTRFTDHATFTVRISGDRYQELQEIARTIGLTEKPEHDQDVVENEALARVIREGFDI